MNDYVNPFKRIEEPIAMFLRTNWMVQEKIAKLFWVPTGGLSDPIVMSHRYQKIIVKSTYRL